MQIEEYQKHLHKYVEPILQNGRVELVKINPKVIGITLYFCNEESTRFVSELRKNLGKKYLMEDQIYTSEKMILKKV